MCGEEVAEGEGRAGLFMGGRWVGSLGGHMVKTFDIKALAATLRVRRAV
jgi:hypothetical protein